MRHESEDTAVNFQLENGVAYSHRIAVARLETQAVIRQISTCEESDAGFEILNQFVGDLLKNNKHANHMFHCKIDDE